MLGPRCRPPGEGEGRSSSSLGLPIGDGPRLKHGSSDRLGQDLDVRVDRVEGKGLFINILCLLHTIVPTTRPGAKDRRKECS